MPRESPKFARHAMSEIQHDVIEWDYGEAPESPESGSVEDGNPQPGDDASAAQPQSTRSLTVCPLPESFSA